jgi:hypothetical protein
MDKNVVSYIISFIILLKMWIFEFSLWVGSTELQGLVYSLVYLVSSRRQVLLEVHYIRLFCHRWYQSINEEIKV